MLLVVAGSWRCALTSPGDYNDTSRFNKQSKRSRLRSRLRLRLRLRPLACFLLYFAFALGSFDNNCRFAENFQCHHRILQVLQAFCHSLHNRKQTHRLTLNRQTGTDTDTGTDTHRYTHTHTLSLSTWPHPPPDFVGRRRADAFSPSETTKKAKAKAERAPKLRRKCGHKQACKVQASERFSPGWCGCNVVVCVCVCVRVREGCHQESGECSLHGSCQLRARHQLGPFLQRGAQNIQEQQSMARNKCRHLLQLSSPLIPSLITHTPKQTNNQPNKTKACL